MFVSEFDIVVPMSLFPNLLVNHFVLYSVTICILLLWTRYYSIYTTTNIARRICFDGEFIINSFLLQLKLMDLRAAADSA
jgi:hypothetical protein